MMRPRNEERFYGTKIYRTNLLFAWALNFGFQTARIPNYKIKVVQEMPGMLSCKKLGATKGKGILEKYMSDGQQIVENMLNKKIKRNKKFVECGWPEDEWEEDELAFKKCQNEGVIPRELAEQTIDFGVDYYFKDRKKRYELDEEAKEIEFNNKDYKLKRIPRSEARFEERNWYEFLFDYHQVMLGDLSTWRNIMRQQLGQAFYHRINCAYLWIRGNLIVYVNQFRWPLTGIPYSRWLNLQKIFFNEPKDLKTLILEMPEEFENNMSEMFHI